MLRVSPFSAGTYWDMCQWRCRGAKWVVLGTSPLMKRLVWRDMLISLL
jgi:hypothetical protein